MLHPVIDIIIPVYNAYDDLQRCLDSVLRTAASSCRLILIDDSSPDSRIADYFETLRGKADSRLLLLRNDVNLGFVGTVNRAMALGQNDVILLNSDTVVTSGWLEKIRCCAASDPRIGTITPFSNNAEICSFPNFCEDNPLPPGMSAEDVNRAIEQAAVPIYPDIPTGVGFCMYIRRALLNKIGLFDAETFGLGYGEENDFCMRAVQAGYRNVLCDDTFILHVGSSSFDSKKGALTQENMQRLVAKHPSYLKKVTSFIAADPFKPIRDLAYSFLHLLGESGQRPGVLHVLHGHKGGTENHIRHLMAAGRGRLRQYLLATFDDVWVLEDANGERLVTYHLKREQDELWGSLLGGLCATFNIHVCHVHHLAGCRLGLLEAFAALSIPYGFTAHDFYLACPTINLLGPDGDYCGAQTDMNHCSQCLSDQPDFAGIDIAAWRRVHQKFLERAAFVIAPSEWAASTFQCYFPQTKIAIIPHGSGHEGEEHEHTLCSVLLLPDDGRENIGVLGAIGPVKGARRLEKLVKRTRERDLPLRWVVVGYLDRQFQAYQDKDKVLTVNGQYDSRDVGALLDHYRIRLVAFPSAGPETYCYTLTEAWQAGRPALVPPIGALGERVSATGAGWLMEDWQDEDRILDQILSILKPEHEADMDRAMQAARAIPLFTLARMAEDTERTYGNLAQSGTWQVPMSNLRLYQAGKADSGGESNAIDVVIPVYKGLSETRQCIESVLNSQQQRAFELIIVDDASPEPEMVAYLDNLAATGAITLLRNKHNLGFVQSANSGMSLHSKRDVVLLNSDTMVANDWLDRLHHCTYSAPDIGTATPFSNNATICSYPEFCAENALPEGVELSELDEMFRRVNHGKSVVIPTAVGFCMYIRRACLDQVGLFDSGNFGKGYGEENDFSMRASQQGWLNLLCADTFVYHAGGVSFMSEKDARVATALEVLHRLHPGYEDLIRRFIAADPVRELRAAVDMELAAYRARKMSAWCKLRSSISKFLKNFQ